MVRGLTDTNLLCLQVQAAQKNAISHRARAPQKLRAYL